MSVSPALIESVWVRLFCSISHRACVGFGSKSVPFHSSACLDLVHSHFCCDSDWFRLDVRAAYRLFSFDTESLSDSGLSPPRLSMNVLVQSTSVTACELCSMSSDACCACRCQGGYLCCRIGHRSPPLFHYLSVFPLFSCFSSALIFLSPLLFSPASLSLFFSLTPSSFSLICTDTFVKSAHYVLHWPCIAFYIWHKAVNDTEKSEHMKKRKRSTQRKEPRGLVAFKCERVRAGISHQCHCLFFWMLPRHWCIQDKTEGLLQ